MNFSTHSNQFLLALLVLLVVDTGVSLSAYRWLTKTRTVQVSGQQPPVDITTPAQQARGEKAISVLWESQVITRVVPTPVVYYVWAGYLGLGFAVVMWVVGWLRQGNA